MLNIFRTLIFYCCWLIITVIYSTLSLFSVLLPIKIRYRIITFYSIIIVKLVEIICGLRFEVHGLENMPTEPCLILSNHQSTWETLAFQKIFPLQTWVVKKELLRIPFFGWALALLKPIAIDRNKKLAAFDQIIEQGKQKLKDGFWLIVFPEGTRNPPGKRKKFSKSASVLAEKAETTVLPVAHNAGVFWRKHTFVIKPGTISVLIGVPIPPGHNAREINERTQTWVFQKLAEING